MLNGTLCASERALCCLVENYQTEEGIRVPDVLIPYVGTEFIPYIKERLPGYEKEKKVEKEKEKKEKPKKQEKVEKVENKENENK